LGDRKSIRAIEKLVVGRDDSTGALHGLQLQLSTPVPSYLASIKPANLGSPGKMAVKTKRERESSDAT